MLNGIFVFFAISLILISSFLIFLTPKNDKKFKEPVKKSNLIGANIVYIEGNVEYKDESGVWKRASEGIDLFEGYSVEVLGDGRAIINLDDGSAVRLNSESIVSLDSMNPNHIVLSNEKGEIYSRVVKLDREFDIKSDNYIYKSLGTAYKTINKKDKKGVDVYQGDVKFVDVGVKEDETTENKKKELLIGEGKKYYLVNSENKQSVGNIEKISIEEIEKDDFVAWNRKKDQENNEFKKEMGVLKDSLPPIVSIISPANLFETEASYVTAKGKTEAGAKVLINGSEVKNDKGEFSLKVNLVTGKNVIEIKVIDGSGNIATKKITVTKRVKAVKKETIKFVLSGKSTDSGIKLSWSFSGIDAGNGFKIVKGASSNPVYPGNDYKYISDSDTRSYLWKITDGKTYHFRVCQYKEGKCLKYSNNIKVTATKLSSGVKSINISSSGGGKVSWTVDGVSSNGFKLVWSKNSKPVYPTRDGDKYNYFSSPDIKSGTIEAFSGSGKYYVRVCEYLGGKCGVYSNQIEVNL